MTRLVLIGLGVALTVATILGVAIGPVSFTLDQLVDALGGSSDGALIRGIRLPRVLLAVLTGAALALAGTGLQAVLRNPLADPGLLGVSAGAALAVALVLVVGGLFTGPTRAVPTGLGPDGATLAVAAFAGGMAGAMSVAGLTRLATPGQSGLTTDATLVLAGVGVNALAGALLGILLARASDPALRALTFWTLGSLNGATWSGVTTVAVAVVVGAGVLRRDARALDVLQLGGRDAMAAGLRVRSLERRILATSALLAGAAVSMTGVIGFVGLVAPHLARLALGPGHRVLLPAAALVGALLMVVADGLARTVWAPAELPVGILTALLGVPVFFALVIRAGRQVAL